MKPVLTALVLIALTAAAAEAMARSARGGGGPRGGGVPRIDVAPSCRAASSSGGGLVQSYDSCLRSEDAARQTLVKQWSGFPPADRASCYTLTTTGTPGTYTELITCLEMKRDVRTLPAADNTAALAGRRRRR
jgi:hypothetical protein